jgi:tetratricopeptide (TPR) repeat protein
MAAGLATQAKFMQVILAGHRLDFVNREIHCVDAVRLGALSGDRNLHAIALEWHGSTCTLCYDQPLRAIPLLNDALSSLDNELYKDIQQRKRSLLYAPPSLVRSAIYGSLSVAYAQNGDETEAREYAEMARTAMPSHPELDFWYRCIQFNASGLDKYKAIMCLHLADHFPESDYAQKAYDALEESTSKQPLNQSSLGQALIKKADAAHSLGDMRGCMADLTKGFRIGDELKSLRRLIEAHNVISNMSEKWKRETAVKDLQKDITHAIVIVRRNL